MAADGRTMHGGTYNSNALVCAAVIAAGARPAPTASTTGSTRAARGWPTAWSRPPSDGRARGLLERRRRLFQLWFSAEPPSDYREAHAIAAHSPFFDTARRAARTRHPDPAAAGGAVLTRARTPTPTSIARSRRRRRPCRPWQRRLPRRWSVRREDCDETTASRRWHLRRGGADRRRVRQQQLQDRAAVRRPVNGGILKAGIPGNPDHLDPALSYTNEGWEILEATNNGLLTFKKAAGGAGATVVPDIASAMPTVTDGGKTYTFHLRSDVMFSAPGQPGGEAVRLQVLDRAAVPGRLRRRRLLHRHRRREQLRQDPQGRHLRHRRRRQGDDDHVPPDPAGRHVHRLHRHSVRVRDAGGHAGQGRLDDPAVAGADRAVCDHRLRPAPVGHDPAKPPLPLVDAGHAGRPHRRHRRAHRRHAGAVG